MCLGGAPHAGKIDATANLGGDCDSTAKRVLRVKSVLNIFWNDGERRLRTFWRVALYLFLWRATTSLLGDLLIPPAQRALAALFGNPPSWAARGFHFSIALVWTYVFTWIACHLLDRRRVRSLGLHVTWRWWEDMAVGLVLGVTLMALLFGIEAALGWVHVTDTMVLRPEGVSFLVAILALFAVFVAISFSEELVFRGYILCNSAEGFAGSRAHLDAAVVGAWVLSSLLFGLFHVLNPNSSWLSTLNLALGGIMLGLPMILTGRLALGIGLHITWNFAQSSLFGYPVSGYDFSSATFLATESTGPAIWTGGAFGPEAGMLGLLIIALGCGLIVLWLRVRDGSVRLQRSLATPPATNTM